MRNFLLATLATVILVGCVETSTDYLDKNTLFVFKVNDTLVYNSGSVSDSFYVSYKSNYISNVDKRTDVEYLNITMPQINIGCKNGNNVDCGNINIHRQGANYTLISFHSFSSGPGGANKETMTYQIGLSKISNVYKITPNATNNLAKDIKTLYYSHTYGVIAYELYNGEKFELGEKYLN